MMDPSPRKKGGAVLALAAAAIVLSGSLVSCQTSGPPPAEEPVNDPSDAVLGHWAWIESVDLEGRSVTYIPMTPEQRDDRRASGRSWGIWSGRPRLCGRT